MDALLFKSEHFQIFFLNQRFWTSKFTISNVTFPGIVTPNSRILLNNRMLIEIYVKSLQEKSEEEISPKVLLQAKLTLMKNTSVTSVRYGHFAPLFICVKDTSGIRISYGVEF